MNRSAFHVLMEAHLDDTWIKINMAPLRGWGSKGERLRGFAQHGHWRSLTFLGRAAL